MILRGRLDLRLAGRRREPVRTSLVEGMAHLLVTGAFHRWIEIEAATAGTNALKMVALLPQDLGWQVLSVTADGRDLAEARTAGPDGLAGLATQLTDAGHASVRLSGLLEGLPVVAEVRTRMRHPRGRPGATLELIGFPALGNEDQLDGSWLRRRALRLLEEGHQGDAELVRQHAALGALLELLESLAREALRPDASSREMDVTWVRTWPDEILGLLPAPSVAAMTTWSVLAAEPGAWPSGAVLAPADGGGSFQGGGELLDGGGSLDHGGLADAGGGHLGTP